MLIHLEAQAMPLDGKNCISHLHVATYAKTKENCVNGEAG